MHFKFFILNSDDEWRNYVLHIYFLPLSQVQDYITAGACMALGLRFAGSANSDAFDCLYEFAKSFMKVMSFYGSPAMVSRYACNHHIGFASATIHLWFPQEPGCYNIQTALSMILLSMSMVMSGTGNLKVLQLCRFLHYRTGNEMNYGFHMAHHMALGMLFLGGGRWDANTSTHKMAKQCYSRYSQGSELSTTANHEILQWRPS